jgi:hypothetical protein
VHISCIEMVAERVALRTGPCSTSATVIFLHKDKTKAQKIAAVAPRSIVDFHERLDGRFQRRGVLDQVVSSERAEKCMHRDKQSNGEPFFCREMVASLSSSCLRYSLQRNGTEGSAGCLDERLASIEDCRVTLGLGGTTGGAFLTSILGDWAFGDACVRHEKTNGTGR